MKDAIYEKDAIVNQNKSNQKQVSEMSLRSKAELMLTNNKLTDLGNEIDQLQRQYQDKNKQFELQKAATEKLNTQISAQLQ